MGFVFFVFLLCEFEIYEKFDEVIIMYICCEVGELIYGCELIESFKDDEFLNEVIGEGFWKKIKYYLIIICEESVKMGCIIDLMKLGEVFVDLGVEFLNLEIDCVMICGNFVFNLEFKDLFENIYGFEEGVNFKLVYYVVEKVFFD